jgi:hypothetical protein
VGFGGFFFVGDEGGALFVGLPEIGVVVGNRSAFSSGLLASSLVPKKDDNSLSVMRVANVSCLKGSHEPTKDMLSTDVAGVVPVLLTVADERPLPTFLKFRPLGEGEPGGDHAGVEAEVLSYFT